MTSNLESFLKNSNIIVFKGRRDVLSNAYPCALYYQEVWFNCAEQAYQWEKARFHKRMDIAKNIVKVKSVNMQKHCTSPIVESDEWLMSARLYYMRQILDAKSECVLEYRQTLIRSHGSIALAVVGERFWSCGLSKEAVFQGKPSDYVGENMLGKLHMELRSELQMTKSLLASLRDRLDRKLLCEFNHGIERIEMDSDRIMMTVYCSSMNKAYAFTDDLCIPRKLVRVMLDLDI